MNFMMLWKFMEFYHVMGVYENLINLTKGSMINKLFYGVSSRVMTNKPGMPKIDLGYH